MRHRRPSRRGGALRAPSGRWPGSAVGCAQVSQWADSSARRLLRTWSRPQSFRIEVRPMPTVSAADAAVLGSHRVDAEGNVTVTLYAWPLLSASAATSGGEPSEVLVHQALTEQLGDALGVHPDDL